MNRYKVTGRNPNKSAVFVQAVDEAEARVKAMTEWYGPPKKDQRYFGTGLDVELLKDVPEKKGK